MFTPPKRVFTSPERVFTFPKQPFTFVRNGCSRSPETRNDANCAEVWVPKGREIDLECLLADGLLEADPSVRYLLAGSGDPIPYRLTEQGRALVDGLRGRTDLGPA